MRNMNDTEFWAFVHHDPAFRARFHGHVHPLQPANGGVNFYNPENLTVMLVKAQTDFDAAPKVGVSAWGRRNRVRVIESWIQQVDFIWAALRLDINDALR